jgi:hypothetical protein
MITIIRLILCTKVVLVGTYSYSISTCYKNNWVGGWVGGGIIGTSSKGARSLASKTRATNPLAGESQSEQGVALQPRVSYFRVDIDT